MSKPEERLGSSRRSEAIGRVCLVLAALAGCCTKTEGGGTDGGTDAGTGCSISGLSYLPGQVNASNRCEVCQPLLARLAWSSAPLGTPCGDGGAICNGMTCAPGCDFGAGLVQPSTLEPGNPCRACQPEISTTSWTDLPWGTACGAQVACKRGACKPACVIAGITYGSGQANPEDAAQCCNPATDSSDWIARFSDGGVYLVTDGGQAISGLVGGHFRGADYLDLAFTKGPGLTGGKDPNVTILRNTAGHLEMLPEVFVGGQPGSLRVGDIDEDGRDDLVVGQDNPDDFSDGDLTVLLSNGDGTFSTAACCRRFSKATPIVADFNGDGHLDLLGLIIDGTAKLALGIGDGGFGSPFSVSSSPAFSSRSSAPVGRERRIALFSQPADYNLDFIGVSLFDPDAGDFSAPVSYSTGGPDPGLNLGDANGDGITDIISGHRMAGTTSSIEVLQGLEDGGFAAPVRSDSLTESFVWDVADLDGDGRADLVLGTITSVAIQVHVPDGGFGQAANILVSPSVWLVLAVDLNGDGAPDLAVIDGYAPNFPSSLRVLTNNCGQ